jgi:hypothetical protein
MSNNQIDPNELIRLLLQQQQPAHSSAPAPTANSTFGLLGNIMTAVTASATSSNPAPGVFLKPPNNATHELYSLATSLASTGQPSAAASTIEKGIISSGQHPQMTLTSNEQGHSLRQQRQHEYNQVRR